MSSLLDSNINIAFEEYTEEHAPIIGEFYGIVAINTTGLHVEYGDKIIEIGVTVLDAAYNIVEQQHTLVDPEITIAESPYHNITNKMLEDAPTFNEINAEFLTLIHNKLLVMYPTSFTAGFINNVISGKPITDNNVLNLFDYARLYAPSLDNHRLPTVLKHYGLEFDDLKPVKNKMDALHALLKKVFPTHENTKAIASETHVSYFNPASEGYSPIFALWKPNPKV